VPEVSVYDNPQSKDFGQSELECYFAHFFSFSFLLGCRAGERGLGGSSGGVRFVGLCDWLDELVGLDHR